MANLDHLSVGSCKAILANIFHNSFGKSTLGLILCGYNWLFADPQIFIAVYVLILFDTITGFARAIKDKDVHSSEFFRVMVKCIVYFLMILTGRIVDKVVPFSFAATIIESFLVMTEALSIMENLGMLGFPVPSKLLKYLKVVKIKKIENHLP